MAEDNRGDVHLVQLALREHGVPFTMRVANDGELALDVVNRLGKDEKVPDLAVLDLNLPRQEGEKVLRSLRSHPCCGTTPVIVMTSSLNQRDRAVAERYNAEYFVKPTDLNAFLELGALVKKLFPQSNN